MIREKAKVYVQGPPYYDITCRVFKNANKYEIVDNIKISDIVVFTGGEDINPVLYGEKPVRGVYFNVERDKRDLASLEEAYKTNKFLVGICRGAQLINCIPNKGKLWQDVDGHGDCIHSVFDTLTGKWLEPGINSVHHQMLRVTEKAQIVAWTNVSTERVSEKDTWFRPKPLDWHGGMTLERDKDPEVVWYPDTFSLLFQGHPEFGHPPTTKYFFRLMDEYYWMGKK